MAEGERDLDAKHFEAIESLKKRTFSGSDLLNIMARAGIGAGATVHLIESIEYDQQQPNSVYPPWDFPPDETESPET